MRWRLERLTPVTAAAIALLLPLKLIDVGHALRSGGSLLNAAQAEPAPKPAVGAMPAPEPAAAASPKPMPAPSAGPRRPVMPEPTVPPVTDDAAISPAERNLLQDLRARRTALETREHTLQQREDVLNATEHRLTARMAEMAALQARLEQMEAARRAHDDANWAGLVKMYETMKPREAAVIFNEMEMPVLLEVMDRMKDAKAAQILGAMQPDRARLITGQLAAQRTRAVAVPPEASPS